MTKQRNTHRHDQAPANKPIAVHPVLNDTLVTLAHQRSTRRGSHIAKHSVVIDLLDAALQAAVEARTRGEQGATAIIDRVTQAQQSLSADEELHRVLTQVGTEPAHVQNWTRSIHVTTAMGLRLDQEVVTWRGELLRTITKQGLVQLLLLYGLIAEASNPRDEPVRGLIQRAPKSCSERMCASP